MTPILLESELACPHCGHRKTETMPTDACQWFYECVSCRTLLKPKPGDCCVFCSYGTVPCPPVQARRDDGLTGWLAEGCFDFLPNETILDISNTLIPAGICRLCPQQPERISS